VTDATRQRIHASRYVHEEHVRPLSVDSLAMYTMALASEIPVILIRTTLMFMLAAMILLASGHLPDPASTWIELSLIPTAWSLLALATPLGTGWWWKQRTGGRRPSVPRATRLPGRGRAAASPDTRAAGATEKLVRA
jgi:hypothetical protein